MGKVASALRRKGLTELSHRRDEYAAWLINSPGALAATANDGPIFLILRGFQSDRTRVVDDDHTTMASPSNPRRYLRSPMRQLDSFITEALQIWGPVLAYSRPTGSPPGTEMSQHDYPHAYASISEDGWFESFKKVASLSSGIILFPSGTDGCIQELKWIIEEKYLEKCIFVMPPEALSQFQSLVSALVLHFIPWKSATDDTVELIHRQCEFWKVAQTNYAVLGIQLPPYRPSGLLFAVSNERSLKVIQMFDQIKSATYAIPRQIFVLRTAIKTMLLGRIPASAPRNWESRSSKL